MRNPGVLKYVATMALGFVVAAVCTVVLVGVFIERLNTSGGVEGANFSKGVIISYFAFFLIGLSVSVWAISELGKKAPLLDGHSKDNS